MSGTLKTVESKLRILFVEQRTAGKRRAKQRSQIEFDLFEAVTRQQIVVNYQPQFDLLSGRAIGVEALARWTRGNDVWVSPDQFIPMAERCGLICDLGASVLHQACDSAFEWSQGPGVQPTLSVNVSTLQLNDSFCCMVSRVLEVTGFSPRRLELEITETSMMNDLPAALACLSAWRKLGVRIAMDDFGAGFSSLSYLSRLPIDRLKLDKSFVSRMSDDAKTATIVRSVLALGAELDIEVMAEGIETEQQLAQLQDMGCVQGQGDLLARAATAEQARGVLGRTWGTRWSRGLYAA
jgi:diguanylate cyclase